MKNHSRLELESLNATSFISKKRKRKPEEVSDLLKLTQPVNEQEVSFLLASLSIQYSLLPFQELSPNAAGSSYEGAGLQTRQVPPPRLCMDVQ